MYLKHLYLLACPKCFGELQCSKIESGEADVLVMEGELACTSCDTKYPIVSGVPRFVPRENYASGFGLEWIKHARTQYDSYSGLPISEERFFESTHWPRDLQGELILEVGSGSGRFTEQAAKTGATVVSFDYSYAVEANFQSNGEHENVLIVQADVFAMPFADATFDRLFCFGMLQHTPSPSRALEALPRVVKPNGSICADVYKVTLSRMLQTKYLVRPITRKMNPDRLYERVIKWVDFMWPLATQIRKLPKGSGINWRLLVADDSPLGVSGDMLKEWSYLNTFDMLAPHYDRPASIRTFKRWANSAGIDNIGVEYTGHGVVLRGSAP